MISYRKNYIYIYIWQAISITLGFASLFVVTPFLSSNKVVYGIYSLCLSLTIFFAYADMGFVSAANKFAAECYIRGDLEGEIKIIGFTSFIMIIGFSVISLVIGLFAYEPCILMPELIVGSDNYLFARYMLLILSLSFPLLIAQRVLNVIFLIRVEDYKYQRLSILGNVIRLLSAFYFFTNGRFMILEFYFFYQLIQIFIVFSLLLYIRNYGYKMSLFYNHFKFNKEIFDKVKRLSATSLVLTICMIVYYEIDQVVISHLLGIEAVAIYGIALSALGVIRMYQSLVYSPYMSRYNHFSGNEDYKGLSQFVNKIIILVGPILVIPIMNLSFLSEPFVVSWVGSDYQQSALLISFMVLSFTVNSIKDPGSAYFVAMEKNKYLLYANLSLPFVYWAGILLSYNYWGILSFAVFKFVAPLSTTIYYWFLLKNDFRSRGFEFVTFKEIMATIVFPSIAAFGISRLILPFMIFSKGKYELANNILFLSLSVLLSFGVVILFNDLMRKELLKILNTFRMQFVKK